MVAANLTDNLSDFTPQQQAMVDVWEKRMRADFVDRSADAALATMSATPHLNHVPAMTGGIGREEIRAFCAERFIPQIPQDAEIDLVSRTVGSNTVADEFVFKCTHSRIMDFFLPVSRASAFSFAVSDASKCSFFLLSSNQTQ